jgi:alpha-1,6-mannosyl-glycoprotein beta-1,2-N-acetylglucosaminyltransferase
MNDIFPRSIKFAPVAQMFYPFSLQTHPRSFPGESPTDCPRDAKGASLLNCSNFDSPDAFGHYREANMTQAKHHWWWKANWIFNGLHLTQQFLGLVLFLEEDHYLAPDFLHVLRLMAEIR